MDLLNKETILKRAKAQSEESGFKKQFYSEYRQFVLVVIGVSLLMGFLLYSTAANVALVMPIIERFGLSRFPLLLTINWEILILVAILCWFYRNLLFVWLRRSVAVSGVFASLVTGVVGIYSISNSDFLKNTPSRQFAVLSLQQELNSSNKDQGTIARVDSLGKDYQVSVQNPYGVRTYLMPSPSFVPKPGDKLWLSYDATVVPARIVDMGLITK